MDVLALLIALVVILAGAEMFTNGVEWLGRHLGLGVGAIGSVLAAVGTALPETMIPLIAILFGGTENADEIGIGAVLGAPFMLGTLAMFVTGMGILAFRGRRRAGTTATVDRTILAHDIRWFLVGYAVAIAVAFVPVELGPVRTGTAIALIGLYVWYVRKHLGAEAAEDAEDLEPLRLRRLDRRHHLYEEPRLWVVVLQVLVALGCIIGGAVIFVQAVERVALTVGIGSTILALVIAPIATELPEKFNSVIWVRQGKDTLALGNITGAMVFQSAIPTSVALFFAPAAWSVTADSWVAFLSAGIAVVSILTILAVARVRGRLSGGTLAIGGLFYAVYLGVVVVSVAG